ncbi:MAG: hypothetical protein V1928_05280 [Parcubacteria group bacterium]
MMIKKMIKTLYILAFIGLFINLIFSWPPLDSPNWIFYFCFGLPISFILANYLCEIAERWAIKRNGKNPRSDNGVIF